MSKNDSRLIAMMSFHFSRGISAVGAVCWMPALLQRISTGPLLRILDIKSSVAATSRKSETCDSTFPAPAALTCASAFAITSSLAKPCRTMSAPSLANAVAIPKPIPWNEPVTNARRPFSVMVSLHILQLRFAHIRMDARTCRNGLHH